MSVFLIRENRHCIPEHLTSFLSSDIIADIFPVSCFIVPFQESRVSDFALM